MRKTLLSFAAFIVTLSGVAVMSSAPASAMSGTCASHGYSLVKSYPINETRSDGTFVARTGTLEVYYKSSTGKNCAMAKCANGAYNWCFDMYRVVAIKDGKNTSQWEGWNGGMFHSYAGPVETSKSERGRCIDVYARFGTSADSTDDTFGSINKADILCN